ncbi:4F2 cell-surface antigen heavy chain-like isoform X2 [Pristis pectinata]|uniref:4F2 cell-surface antigen heavy chain-like isoform X2 n=1 Tax=Pristis pectinata TaxID=685728 RepID=UPI00223CC6EB|nr:4F2 cell-surface antigen heavy chain-like isoform X2 [Pristis pectinata]
MADFLNSGKLEQARIQRQLQYIAQLHVVAIIIVPYDNLNQTAHTLNVSRLREDVFGDTEDLKPLLKAAAKYGMKVILDLTLFSALLESNISASIDRDNEGILQQLMTEFRFWFREGVDGIFIKMSTVSLKKTFIIELLKTWKKIARRYSSSSKERIFIIATSKEEHDYLISVLINVPGVMIFVYYLNDLLTNSKITEKASTLDDYNHKLEFEWCGFIFGEGHIASMILQRQQGTHIKLFAILLLTMPGTPLFHYGDEIALKDYKESKYPLMRWDKSKYAGFTNSLPWISPDLNVYTPTVSQQSEDPLSVLSFYRALGKIRIEEPPLQYGDFYIMINTTNVLAYIRQWDQTGILVIMNFGGPVTYDFTAVYLPSTALLLAKSSDVSQCGLINLQNMAIEANMGYILKYFIAE